MPSNQTFSRVMAATALAVAAAIPAQSVAAPEPGCRLIVSDKTKALYPAGFLELAAQNCWAGPQTDIVVFGKGDVLPRGSGEHSRMNSSLLDYAGQRIAEVLPPDISTRMARVRDDKGNPIHQKILGAALSDNGGIALHYKFAESPRSGEPEKKVFVTIVDPIHHIQDKLAGLGGLYIGTHVNSWLHYEGESLDLPTMRAFTFAHESGHGKHEHGSIVIQDDKEIKPADPTTADRMHHETEAERDAHANFKQALDHGVKMKAAYAGLDFGLRSLGSYFAGRHGDLPFAHAVNFGLHPEFLTTKPEEQLAGMRLFRRELDKATGNALLDPDKGTVKPAILDLVDKTTKDDLKICHADAVDAVDSRPAGDDEWDAYTEAMGHCVAGHIFIRGLAINGLVELEKDPNPFGGNRVAQIFAADFKAAVSANILSDYAVGMAEKIYSKTQEADVAPASRAFWDKVLKRTP